MSEAEEFDRTEVGVEDYRHELGSNGTNGSDSRRDQGRDQKPAPFVREPAPRAVGTSLPRGGSGKSPLPDPLPGPASDMGPGQSGRTSVPPPGRSLSVPAQSEVEMSSGMQWVLSVMKQAVPFVRKLLPVLDGQLASAVANVLVNRPHAPLPPPRVDLQPIENRLTEFEIQQRGLKDQLADQNASLKRVEDKLESVREATDRNTLEQQELVQDLKTMGTRVNLLALLFLGLLVISVLLNIFLFLHIQRVLP